MDLVDIAAFVPDVIIDLRYATPNNITHRVLYNQKNPKAKLSRVAALRLASAAEEFSQHGLKIVVWDGYRSLAVQKKLLGANNDQRYVLEESKHCKGLAIDLTLAKRNNKLLDMGTDYDDFTEKAHVTANCLTPEQVSNRQILLTTMQRNGFKQWPYEWWHFDYVLA